MIDTNLIKITRLKNANALDITTNFLDNTGNLVKILYDNDEMDFTDGGKLNFEFSLANLHLDAYAEQIKALMPAGANIHISKATHEIVWQMPFTHDNLTVYLQGILSLYTYLNILTHEDNFI